MINIAIMVNSSESNRLDKKLSTILSLSGTLKQETSLIDPTILIECNLEDVVNANYMHIPSFGRYYFIRNMRSISTNHVEFTCHVDVLTTYKDAIRANTGIVSKQEHDWNLYLNDGSFRIYQNPNVLTKAFPSGFSRQEFVMAIAGS